MHCRRAGALIALAAGIALALTCWSDAVAQSMRDAVIGDAKIHKNYEVRLLRAPPDIKQRVADLDREVKAKNYTFRVGYTDALRRPPANLNGTIIPANFLEIAKIQNAFAAKALALDERAMQLAGIRGNAVCGSQTRAFSWVARGMVTPIKDQRPTCGSCWAFAAISSFESSYLIRNGRTIDTSEQQTLRCSGAGTCGSGWHNRAMNWLMSHGVVDEAAMPYTASDGLCMPNPAGKYRAVAWGFVDAARPIPTVIDLKAALCIHGPLAVALNATATFQAYTTGVFNEKNTGDVNHSVTIVGWDDTRSAWRIKNSWGVAWGENGYAWVAYDSNKVGTAATWIRARIDRLPILDEQVTLIRQHIGTDVQPFNVRDQKMIIRRPQ